MEESTDAGTLNLTQFANLCGVSAGLVSGWCDEGMPCNRRARSGSTVAIELRSAIPWVVSRRGTKSRGPARPDAAHEQLAQETLELAIAGLIRDVRIGLARMLANLSAELMATTDANGKAD